MLSQPLDLPVILTHTKLFLPPCDLTTPAHAFIHYLLAQTHTRWDLLCWLKQDDLGSVSLGFHDSLSISLSSHLSHSAENAWLPEAGKCICFIASWCKHNTQYIVKCRIAAKQTAIGLPTGMSLYCVLERVNSSICKVLTARRGLLLFLLDGMNGY